MNGALLDVRELFFGGTTTWKELRIESFETCKIWPFGVVEFGEDGKEMYQNGIRMERVYIR